MTRSGGRPGSGRGGRSFRGGGRSVGGGRQIGGRASVRGGSGIRVSGVRVGRGSVGTSGVFVGARYGSGQTSISVASTGIDGRPTSYNINIRYVYSANAIVNATWRESGSEAGQIGYSFQGTFNANRRNVPAEDLQDVLSNMDAQAVRTAEGLAIARAANLQDSAVKKLVGNVQDYLRFSSSRVSVTGVSGG